MQRPGSASMRKVAFLKRQVLLMQTGFMQLQYVTTLHSLLQTNSSRGSSQPAATDILAPSVADHNLVPLRGVPVPERLLEVGHQNEYASSISVEISADPQSRDDGQS
jgi:hypothetical protein